MPGDPANPMDSGTCRVQSGTIWQVDEHTIHAACSYFLVARMQDEETPITYVLEIRNVFEKAMALSRMMDIANLLAHRTLAHNGMYIELHTALR